VMSFCHFSGLNPRPFIGRQRLAAERLSRLVDGSHLHEL